jgi:putative transposase
MPPRRLYSRDVGRVPREQPAGGIFHLTSRGNRRQRIARDEFDYHSFLRIFGKVVERYSWRCVSYCLMPNHYHLVVETPEESLARGMRLLNGIHAQRFNWRHGYEGHLFERPYRSKLVSDEAHLLECVRYDVLNPVRAGICERPEQWPWSSHRAAAGLVPPPKFLDLARMYELFASFSDDRRRAYAAFVSDGWLAAPRPGTWSGDVAARAALSA